MRAIVISVICAAYASSLSVALAQSHPSGFTSRVLVLVQNPTGFTSSGVSYIAPQYSLQIENAALAAGNPSSNPYKWPSISNWSGAMPAAIENLPSSQLGAVSNEDGSLSLIDYVHETVTTANVGILSPSAGTILSQNLRYAIAANRQAGALTVVDRNSQNPAVSLNLAGVSGVSITPGTSVALVFADDSNIVYMLRHLSGTDSQAFANGAWPTNATDCEPYSLPTFCLVQVTAPGVSPATYGSQNFDAPFKSLSSADGSSIYVLSAGPEGDGVTAKVTVLPAGPLALEDGSQTGSLPATPIIYTVPGGVDDGVVAGNTLYVAGQEYDPITKHWGGQLSVIDTTQSSYTVSSSFSMADGHPVRMALADDNTLWIGSRGCNTGVRAYNAALATGSAQTAVDAYGCLTVVNTTSMSTAWVEPYLCDLDGSQACTSSSTPALDFGTGGSGDVTGIAPIIGHHVVYYVEHGQVHARSTVTSNSTYPLVSANGDSSSGNYNNVTVSGTAVDIVYMDAPSNSDGTSTSTHH